MSMYDRFAKDLSEELFNSVYDDLYELASKQQKAIYDNSRGWYSSMGVGECQETLDGFCRGKTSLGETLDFIKTYKAM